MNQTIFSPTHLKLLASLRSDPAYLLLIDYLQKVADDLTDELAADKNLGDHELIPRIRYWQAFCEILSIMRKQPETWAEEFKEFDIPEVSPSADPEWLTLMRRVQQANQQRMESDKLE